MSHEVVNGAGMPKPLGPYSPVVRVGHLLFLSAQTGVDQSTGTVPQGGFEAECRQAFTNLGQALRASGSDLADLPIVNRVYTEVFPTNPPARTAAVVGLAGGRRISVDAIAVLPGSE